MTTPTDDGLPPEIQHVLDDTFARLRAEEADGISHGPTDPETAQAREHHHAGWDTERDETYRTARGTGVGCALALVVVLAIATLLAVGITGALRATTDHTTGPALIAAAPHTTPGQAPSAEPPAAPSPAPVSHT